MPTNKTKTPTMTQNGQPRKSNAGRKPKPGAVARTMGLAPDVNKILSEVKNATAYTEKAVRAFYEAGNRE